MQMLAIRGANGATESGQLRRIRSAKLTSNVEVGLVALRVRSRAGFCREHLAAFKVPRVYEFRDGLPKSAVGKVLRRQLIAEERLPPGA